MKYSVIWNVTDHKDRNEKTKAYLQKELASYKHDVQILLYNAGADFLSGLDLPENAKVEPVKDFQDSREAEIIKDAAGRVRGEYVTEIISGDVWSDGTLAEVDKRRKQFTSQTVFMLRKIMPDGEPGAFSADETERDAVVFYLSGKYNCYPFYFGGTFIKSSLLKETPIDPDLGADAERRFFLDILLKQMSVTFIRCRKYFSIREREGDLLYFQGIYDPDFYMKSYTDFWIPWLTEIRETKGEIPFFLQYHAMFTTQKKITANLNNKNKHVVPEGKEEEVIGLMGDMIRLLDDDVITNAHRIAECVIGDSFKWFFGILKYGQDYKFRKQYLAGKTYYSAGRVLMNTIENLSTNIAFMDYREGILHIDGAIHPLVYSMASEVYFTVGGQKVMPVYNGRYGLEKIFGVSIYKTHSFHLEVPLASVTDIHIFCMAEIEGERIKIKYKYESHFSRMSDRFLNSYWWFGKETPFLMTKRENGLRIRRMNKETEKKDHREREKMLLKEMLHAPEDRKRAWLFILIRLAYWFFRPRIKSKPIWMYLDKIYKGGDSAEYLYRYASAQKEDIRHYYLIDKKTSDYQRLKKDGYKPLVRGSIKHRLIFMMADMMVISNSTVYAFNNFGMINSSYIRDLPDFHVCCVQHGMSVQKIAVAQHRLRDNTRLYFCASRYEIRNLMHPIYDYQGYDAVKLTGVPRYDGLVNDDKKQIMISPTWRMQAAAPVRTSEGEQRDYNPLFKESMYYKVFNALINDERLISAAKKYGYKIKYVLHPIVSAQVNDFDKNDYVDIIPAVGDMSYERMFCESSLMVTDFSGIQFDFAYMRKPLVYLHHKDIPQHYEEGSFFYDTMAFGEICHDNDELISLLTEYMAEGCKMKPEYVARADDFFYYSDHNNCERIYKEMLAYQDKYILNEKDISPVPLMKLDLNDRQKDAAAADEILAKEDTIPGRRTINDQYFDDAIIKKTVLVLGLGKNVRGNMQYILNELNHSVYFENYKIYIRGGEDTEPVIQEYIKKNGWNRSSVVVNNGEYAILMETCQFLITEVFFPQGWIKKPGQTVINTWHGVPLKKVGLGKNSRNIHKDGNTQRNFIETDYLLYPNKFTRDIMLDSYAVRDLTGAKAVMLGYPRTGGMLSIGEDEKKELKALLAPENTKIFAYMPTWKDYLKEDTVVLNSLELLKYLDGHLRDDQILYCNLHHKINDSIDYSAFAHIRQFPKTIDTYTLLSVTDALITDYSSVFYDYLAAGKQIILFCDDYELYLKKRGMNMDIRSLPFDIAMTPQEVTDALNRGKTYDDTEAFKTFCEYDSSDSPRLLTELLIHEHMNDIVLEPIESRVRRNIMVFSEKCQKSFETDQLYKLTDLYDKDTSQLYMSCEMLAVDEHKKSAYPLLRVNPVIGVVKEYHFSGRGESLLALYHEGKLSFDQIIDYLQYDLALHAKRMYGSASFDKVCIYDAVSPELILCLSLMESEIILFITDEMINRIKEGDRFLKDAVEYAAGKCRTVYRLTEGYQEVSGEDAGVRIDCKKLDGIEEMYAAVFGPLQDRAV
ncbi:MAG: CDP-glycerol glycerophosphotransferase family protein [Lachnospiraceae bacterium]|nr:CDP-glycerol glycerophosphotransferase family protein [Lachnospiraceae bacterium]